MLCISGFCKFITIYVLPVTGHWRLEDIIIDQQVINPVQTFKRQKADPTRRLPAYCVYTWSA
jgi:hypothetical protein